MKKLFMLLLGTTLIFSCESELALEMTEPCLLTQIKPSGEPFEINVNYDSQNQIESVAYEVREDNNIYNYLTEFQYKENKLDQVQFVDNGVIRKEKVEIEYESNQMKKWIFKSDVEAQEVRLFYQDEKITKIEEWSSCQADETLCLSLTTSFTYSGDNVQKMSTLYENMGESYSLESSYSFDDKNNPFYNNLPLFIGSEQEDFSFLLSKNNVISVSNVSSSDEEVSETWEYEYNAFGFPIAAVSGSGVTSMSYEHCTSN